MTYWKIGDTRISCRVTLDEIREMGFDMQELAQDREKTVDFLGRILEGAKNALGIELPDGIQSFTVQMLPDQSMLIVIACADIEKEIDKNMELLRKRIEAMNTLAASGKLEEIQKLEGQEKADAYNALMEEIEYLLTEREEENIGPGRTGDGISYPVQPLADGSQTGCCVLFDSLDETIRFCNALKPKALVSSRLYKHQNQYYLFADFSENHSEKHAAGFLNLAGEFGGDIRGDGVSEAFLKEHKLCMIADQAVEKLGGIG